VINDKYKIFVVLVVLWLDWTLTELFKYTWLIHAEAFRCLHKYEPVSSDSFMIFGAISISQRFIEYCSINCLIIQAH